MASLLKFLARALGQLLAFCCGAVAFVGAGAEGAHMSGTRLLVLLLAGLAAGVVVHELSHLLSALATGAPVRGLYLGAPPTVLSFPAGKVRVHLGPAPRGRVRFWALPPPGATAVIAAAGPLANLLMAGLTFVTLRKYAEAAALAWVWAGLGATNLVPVHMAPGQPSDGATILRALGRHRAAVKLRELTSVEGWQRCPETVGTLLRAVQHDIPQSRRYFPLLLKLLADAGRVKDLVALRHLVTPPTDTPSEARVQMVHMVEYALLTIPGLRRKIAAVAAERVEWVSGYDSGPSGAFGISHTLALARLRQGRFGEVEPLCAAALSGDLTPRHRAAVLATIVLARKRTGTPYAGILAEARALDPAADLVAEASRSRLSAVPGNAAVNFVCFPYVRVVGKVG